MEPEPQPEPPSEGLPPSPQLTFQDGLVRQSSSLLSASVDAHQPRSPSTGAGSRRSRSAAGVPVKEQPGATCGSDLVRTLSSHEQQEARRDAAAPDVYRFLRRVRLFSEPHSEGGYSLRPEQLADVAAAMVEEVVDIGTVLQEQGLPARGLCVVRQGKMRVSRAAGQTAAGQAVVQETELWAGGVFGDWELRAGFMLGGSTVTGRSNSGRVLWLAPADYQRLIVAATSGGGADSGMPSPSPSCSSIASSPTLAADHSELAWKATEFVTVRYLGVGSFGRVTAVRLKDDGDSDGVVSVGASSGGNEGRIFALKALSKRHILDEKQLECVFKERDVLAEIGHSPYIANLHGFTQDANSLYFLLELALGGDLRSALSQKMAAASSCGGALSARAPVEGLSLDSLVVIGAEVTLALTHIHNHGMIFRDLKPEVRASNGSLYNYIPGNCNDLLVSTNGSTSILPLTN